MCQNSIRRPAVNRNPNFFVRRSDIVYDERVAFIESVCSTLIESRYGPGRVSQMVVKLSDRPELEPAVFYDLSDGAMVPCYALSPVGRNGYQVVEAEFRKAKQMGIVGTRPNEHDSTTTFPSNLGRGSP